MLSRREFLTRGVTVLALVPIAARCSNDTSSSSSYGGGPPTPVACDGVSTTSSVAQSHTHTICVLSTDLSSPPASGRVYTTSNVSAHTHTVSLSADQLRAINGGTTVTVETATAIDPLNGAGHVHAFEISKVA